MTDERIIEYAKQEIVESNKRILRVEEIESANTFVYLMVKHFDRDILNAIDRSGLSFRSLDTKNDDNLRVFCWFRGELIENGVKVETAAYRTEEFEVLSDE